MEENTQPVEQPNLVDRAEKAANNLLEIEKRIEEKTKRLEQLQAERLLGGRTEGAPQVTKPVEEDPKSYAARALKGDFTKK